MEKIIQTQNVGPEKFESNNLKSLNLEPRNPEANIVTIKTHNYKELVNKLVPLITSVQKDEKGLLNVTFNKEPVWDSGVLSVSPEAKAGVALVARSAVYMAAKIKLANDESGLDYETTIQMRELDVNATKYLTKNPWYNDAKSRMGQRPISISEALRIDPNYLKSELKQRGNKKPLFVSLAALQATAVACSLGANINPASETAPIAKSNTPDTVDYRRTVEWPQDAPSLTTWQNESGKNISGFIDENGEKKQFLTYFDVVNPDAKLGEKGYDYGIIALNDKGINTIHRIAGYYSNVTYNPDVKYYQVFYFPIQVPTPNPGK